MSNLKIFNSLTNKKEFFIPIDKSNVRIYACGPTVIKPYRKCKNGSGI